MLINRYAAVLYAINERVKKDALAARLVGSLRTAQRENRRLTNNEVQRLQIENQRLRDAQIRDGGHRPDSGGRPGGWPGGRGSGGRGRRNSGGFNNRGTPLRGQVDGTRNSTGSGENISMLSTLDSELGSPRRKRPRNI